VPSLVNSVQNNNLNLPGGGGPGGIRIPIRMPGGGGGIFGLCGGGGPGGILTPGGGGIMGLIIGLYIKGGGAESKK